MSEHEHDVQIYYEDTDLSGVVYHANYLKYFERAREHIIGGERLADLYDQGVGFVVHKANLTFKRGAKLGDVITIASTYEIESQYRVTFHQRAMLGATLLVEGTVEMVCVDHEGKLVTLPEW
jgi:tol-pal system-associated acyl-CoA thioesterase